MKIGAYVLSEFGTLIAEQDGKTHEDQFQLLEMHFPNVSNQTKAMLMTAARFITLASEWESGDEADEHEAGDGDREGNGQCTYFIYLHS